MSTYLICSGSRSAVDDWSGRHRLAQDEVARPGADPSRSCSVARKMNDRRSARKPSSSSRPAISARVSPVGHGEHDLGRVGRRRIRQLRAEVLADEVGDERHPERGRVVVRPADDGAPDERPQHRHQGDEHDRGEDEREDEELQDPGDAPPLAVRVVPAVGAVAAAAAGPGSVAARARSAAARSRRTSPVRRDAPANRARVRPSGWSFGGLRVCVASGRAVRRARPGG